LKAYSDGGIPGRVIEGIGEIWEFEAIALRVWPGGTPIQTALTCVREILDKAAPDFAAIEKVDIYVSPDVYDQHARFDRPKGVFEALLSYHFAVSSMLRDGDFWLTSVDAAAIEDEKIRAFIDEKVRIHADQALARENGKVALLMQGGETISERVNQAKGTIGNPASISDMSGKFMKCTDGRMSENDAQKLLELILNIEKSSNLREFFDCLRRPKSPRNLTTSYVS